MTTTVAPRRGMGFHLEWLVLVLLACSFTACAPARKIVYIPPEWQQPAPQPRPTAPTAARKASSPTPSQQPVMRPAPQIKETDVAQTPTSSAPESPAEPPAANPARASAPQYVASMHLVEQGQASLAQGNADGAISLLEQAIQVDVYNGEAFFGLARAWKMKGSQGKALEFANKAEILLQDQPKKLKQVYQLKAELYKDLKDKGKADYYLQKAARLN